MYIIDVAERFLQLALNFNPDDDDCGASGNGVF